MEKSTSSSSDPMPYLEQLHGYRNYCLHRDIYLSRHGCNEVLTKPQVVPPEAPNNAPVETKAIYLERRKEYFKMQQQAFGIIAISLSRCGNLLEDVFKENPALRPGSGEKSDASKLIDAVEKYVLQNKASGLYATYTHKLQSLRLEQFESVEALITELDDLYTMTDQTIKSTDGLKITQLGVALGAKFKDFMRNNAYTEGITYMKLCEILRQVSLNTEAAERGAKTTESALKKSSAREEAQSESANYSSSEDDFRARKGSLGSRFESRFEHKRTHQRHRSGSRDYPRRGRDRYRDRSRSRGSSRESSRGSSHDSRDSRHSRDSRDGRRPGNHKRRIRWEDNGRVERQQRDRTNRDHFVNEVVQASKRQNIQCHACKGFGHYKRDCANNRR